ncbi:MAG: hypothetical protein ACYTGV_00595 [Planctomycetota bacterium]|jgi:hypothetical protein
MAFDRRLVVLLLLMAAACSRSTLKGSIVDEHTGGDEFSEMDFWDGLAEVRAVSNNDALHALLLGLADTSAPDYPGRLQEARQRGWVKKQDPMPANETARVGFVARAVCREADIEGGLTMRLFGGGERYAVKELNDRGWLPEMSPNQVISGLQLISLLSETEDFLEEYR